MSRPYVPGAPLPARDHAAASGRALRRRTRALWATVARVLAALPDRHLERPPIGPLVLLTLPYALRILFRPAYAVDFDGGELRGTILLAVTRDGGARSDRFEIVIKGRRCRVRRRRRGHDQRADGTLTVALADLIRTTTAAVDPHSLAASGRVLITGDTFLVVRFPALFRQPSRAVV